MAKKTKPLDLNKVIDVLEEGVPYTAEQIAQSLYLDFTRKSPDRSRLSDALDELLVSGLVRQYGRKFTRPHVSLAAEKDSASVLVGVIQKTPRGSYFKPADPEQKRIHMDSCNVADGTIVTIRPSDDFNSVARVLAEHGNLNDAEGLSLLTALEMKIPMEFPQDVIEETIGMTVPMASPSRRDLTHIPFVAIDPANAKDHDDLVCARKKGKNWVLMVAIADVSHYVRPGTKMFEEARKRGNTAYLPGLTIHMLPERLASGLCSLTAGENRAAIVTSIEIDKDGNIVDYKKEKAIVRSRATLNYDDVQEAMDGFATGKAKELYNKYIKKVEAVAGLLEKESVARGHLNLSVSEQRIDYSAKTGFRLEEERSNRSHEVIAQSMIANNRVAVQELEKLGKPILSRGHGEPSEKSYGKYVAEMEKLGVTPKNDLPLAERVRDLAKQSFVLKKGGEKVRQMLIRVQDRAKYVVGKVQHYGLGIRADQGYTHFTSPIRRFNDLVVHSLVTGRDSEKPEFFKHDNLVEVAKHISMTERRADMAERKAKQRLLAAWLEENMGKVFNARVMNVDIEKGEVEVRGTKQGIHTYIAVDDTSSYKDGKIIEIVPVEADRITGVMRFKMAANDNGSANSNGKSNGHDNDSVAKDGEMEFKRQHPFPRKREMRACVPTGKH